MHIVIVNDFSYVNGGAAQVALSSAAALEAAGEKVIIFSAVDHPTSKQINNSGLQLICTGQHEIAKDKNRIRAVVQGVWNIKAQKAMDDLLATLDPKDTIIHVHSWTKALSSSVVRAAIGKDFKVVCTLHDYFLACPNGGFFDYKRQEICTEKPLSFGCVVRNCDVRSYPQKVWRVMRQIVQKEIGLIPNGIKNFIAISDFSMGVIKYFLPVDSHVHRINNPIIVERAECINAGLNADFTFVGRLSPEKGVELFAHASKFLNLKTKFIGDGDSKIKIQEILPAAQITGWISGEQVIEHLNSARVLVFPSLLYEGSPLTILEAASLGIPAIVADNCAARDMVVDGETGLLFRGGDESDLIAKLDQLRNSELVSNLGKAAYEAYWSSPRTQENHVKDLIKCYKKILSSTL
ncbi:glycosyltransferase family 4 protein [Polynucleobacter sp. AP-RePozz3-80-G7]|uniref:glycosyltransferase family 4 protein n=1 Tax=Polynucleobacter sp. AP-RePozz3-80-G7 TaxID=2689105 RepID=UPI001C0B103E|nr:glycosyltransferase family 4 protein [Polynucleobacter sp. AP-RePozz3-80-G7]MBU3638551.1 glycosyltransferase family 4 protein [Polynucleobacter sp. AP-RePozz3-80-G7]